MRQALLQRAEAVLEKWIRARGGEPTQEEVEGFRLLALHRQGCKGVPSFNACRETCREVAYHFNLIGDGHGRPEAGTEKKLMMMEMLVRHLELFVEGKMEVEGLGDFCCSSRPLRSEEATHA
jgi:hypothetical protein